MRITMLTLATALLLAGIGTAHADEKERLCAAPQGQRLSEDAIRADLTAKGYTEIRSIGEEDGCVEAKGLDSQGKRFEIYLHPVTGEIVARK